MYVAIRRDMKLFQETGTLIWFPYIRIQYVSSRRMDILFSCFTSRHTGEPELTVLLARATKIFNLRRGTPEGTKIHIDFEEKDILRDIDMAYKDTLAMMEQTADAFRERINIDIDWERWRGILIPSRRLMERRGPVLRYLLGRTEADPHALARFLRFIIEEGLGYRGHICVLETNIVYYPIVIIGDDFYEAGWKNSPSLAYLLLYERSEKFRNIVSELT